MIKLFRNIRKNLLAEGKTTNYLKYAIGEIILVVIGILIALSINNNNEAKKDRTRELNYLKNIKTDLFLNNNNIDNFIKKRETQIQSANTVGQYSFRILRRQALDRFGRL